MGRTRRRGDGGMRGNGETGRREERGGWGDAEIGGNKGEIWGMGNIRSFKELRGLAERHCGGDGYF